MAAADSGSKRSVLIVRWIARGLGILASGWWLMMGIGHLVSPQEPMTLEGLTLVLLMGLSIAGFVVAWWRERVGGGVLVVGGIALGIFAYMTAGHNKGFAVLISGVPFLVIGIVFMVLQGRHPQ